MMLDVVRTGQRVVAVGEHGIIIYSDTNGKTWRQAEVPVSVTLAAVYFSTPEKGWAAGHDGVVLHTSDGGASWTKQFDGNKANAVVLAAAEKREKEARKAYAGGAAGNPSAAWQDAERALEDVRAGAKFGPSRPLFDVWFKNETEGIVVGAFGQIFHTGDAGKTWMLWNDRINNPDNLHYNAISVTERGVLLIAGEAGKVYRSANGGTTWATLDTGYTGQLYGVLGIEGEEGGETLIAFGFGGHVFRSTDNGAAWQRVTLNEKKSLVSGLILSHGRIALLTYDGRILRSDDQGRSFKPDAAAEGMSVAALGMIDSGTFIVAGSSGTQIVALNHTPRTKQP